MEKEKEDSSSAAYPLRDKELKEPPYSHSKPSPRMAYVENQGHFGNEASITHLVTALHDSDKGIRASASAELSEIGGSGVILAVNPLLQDTDWRVRYRALEILGKVGDSEVESLLIRALSDEKDHVRYMAAKALGEKGSSEAVPSLNTLLSDENLYVRKRAAETMRGILQRSIHIHQGM